MDEADPRVPAAPAAYRGGSAGADRGSRCPGRSGRRRASKRESRAATSTGASPDLTWRFPYRPWAVRVSGRRGVSGARSRRRWAKCCRRVGEPMPQASPGLVRVRARDSEVGACAWPGAGRRRSPGGGTEGWPNKVRSRSGFPEWWRLEADGAPTRVGTTPSCAARLALGIRRTEDGYEPPGRVCQDFCRLSAKDGLRDDGQWRWG